MSMSINSHSPFPSTSSPWQPLETLNTLQTEYDVFNTASQVATEKTAVLGFRGKVRDSLEDECSARWKDTLTSALLCTYQLRPQLLQWAAPYRGQFWEMVLFICQNLLVSSDDLLWGTSYHIRQVKTSATWNDWDKESCIFNAQDTVNFPSESSSLPKMAMMSWRDL